MLVKSHKSLKAKAQEIESLFLSEASLSFLKRNDWTFFRWSRWIMGSQEVKWTVILNRKDKQNGADGKISIWDWAIEFEWNTLHFNSLISNIVYYWRWWKSPLKMINNTWALRQHDEIRMQANETFTFILISYLFNILHVCSWYLALLSLTRLTVCSTMHFILAFRK